MSIINFILGTDNILKTTFTGEPSEWIPEAARLVLAYEPRTTVREPNTATRPDKPGVRYSLSNPDDDWLWMDSGRFGTVNEFMQWQQGNAGPTFQEQLLTYLEDSGMTNPQFYKAAYIDRKLFSAMITNKNYKPSRDTAIACCFGLKLDGYRAQKLLKTAGYTLSRSIARDRAFYYCLQNGIYDLNDVNELLYYMKEKCIRV